jgi:hypothetical protein
VKKLLIAHLLTLPLFVPFIFGVVFLLFEFDMRPGPFAPLVGFVGWWALFLYGQYVPRVLGDTPAGREALAAAEGRDA